MYGIKHTYDTVGRKPALYPLQTFTCLNSNVTGTKCSGKFEVGVRQAYVRHCHVSGLGQVYSRYIPGMYQNVKGIYQASTWYIT